jgi:molybdopterin molybdotransferase
MERALLGFDMLVTSGGASVGPHDLVRAVQAELRAEEVFWGVSVKPGKPVAFSIRRNTPIFNLPGNPVSVLVTFELFVRPAVNALLGRAERLPRFRSGQLVSTVRRNEHRDEFLRARTASGEGAETLLRPLEGQESHMMVRSGSADALVHVEPGADEVAAGSTVRYLELS